MGGCTSRQQPHVAECVGVEPANITLENGGSRDVNNGAEAPKLAKAKSGSTLHLLDSPNLLATERMDIAVKNLASRRCSTQDAAACLSTLSELCEMEAGREPAMQRGVIEAAMRVLRDNAEDPSIQLHGCELVGRLTAPLRSKRDDAVEPASAVGARQVRAVRLGAIEAAVAAMCAHRNSTGIQEAACLVLGSVTKGSGDPSTGSWERMGYSEAAMKVQEKAANAGAVAAIVSALQAHGQTERLVLVGRWALQSICRTASMRASAVAAGAEESWFEPQFIPRRFDRAPSAPGLAPPSLSATAPAPPGGDVPAPPPTTQRAPQYSVASQATVETLDKIEADAMGMVLRADVYAMELEHAPSGATLDPSMRNQLAQLHGNANKLLTTRLDAILTGDLVSGRDDARARRKALIKQVEALIERLEGLVKRVDEIRAQAH